MAAHIAARNSAGNLDLSPIKKKVVVIFTGNSNTGLAAAESLLSQHGDSITVRAIVRKKTKLPEQLEGKVEVVEADVRQKPHLDAVFKDCKVAMWATPSGKDRVELTKLFLDGCIDHGVDYPIIISMVKAGEDSPHLREFGEIEAYCSSKAGSKTSATKDYGYDVTQKKLQPIILRCGQFYENLYAFWPALQSGVLYLNLGLEGKIPHVSLKDVGDAVCTIALDPATFVSTKPVWNLIAAYNTGGNIARAFTMANCGAKYEAATASVMVDGLVHAGMKREIATKNISVLDYYSGIWPGSNLPNEDFEPLGDLELVLSRAPKSITKFAKETVKLLSTQE